MITQHQKAGYDETGFIVVEKVLSAELLAQINADVDALVAKSAAVSVNDDVYDLEDSHSREEPRVRRIKTPHNVLPSIAELARHPALVAILQALIGPAVRLQTSKLNMKSAGYGAPVEWHQDWAFYPHTNDDLLAVGVFLDDMTPENGPLQIVPGSHRGSVADHHADGYFVGAIDPHGSEIDFSSAQMLTGPAGSLSFHHVRAVHGSALNVSNKPRRLLLFQYTAVDAWPLVEPISDIVDYDAMIVVGEPTLVPRLSSVPVRLPLPPAPNQGSIYENQKGRQSRFFERYEDRAEPLAGSS